MKTFARIALIVAILACAGALFFANKLGGIRKSLEAQNLSLTNRVVALTKDLRDTRADLAATSNTLVQTTETLNKTTGELEAKKVALAQKTQEAETLTTQLADRTAELDKTKAKLDETDKQMQQIKDTLAAAGVSDINNVAELANRVTAQGEENKLLGQQLLAMRNENVALKDKIVELTTTPVNLRGKIAAVQGSWGFVVIDVGRDQRVQTNTNFLVYRDTKMISKVQVREVKETTSIAEILPEFTHTSPRVGDLVVH